MMVSSEHVVFLFNSANPVGDVHTNMEGTTKRATRAHTGLVVWRPSDVVNLISGITVNWAKLCCFKDFVLNCDR